MSHESKPNYFKKKSCKNFKLNQLRPKMTKFILIFETTFCFDKTTFHCCTLQCPNFVVREWMKVPSFKLSNCLIKTIMDLQILSIFLNLFKLTTFFDFRRFVPLPTFVTLLLDQIGWTKHTYYNRMYNRCDLYWGQA